MIWLKQFVFYAMIIVGMHQCKSSNESATGKRKKIERERQTLFGQLDSASYNSLVVFLKRELNTDIQDTILVRYDYNDMKCWAPLDEMSDTYIQGILNIHQEYFKSYKEQRPKITVVEYRESGKNIPKLLKWNKDIKIDASGFILNNIIKDRVQCGITMMIFPDRKFLKFRLDPHYEILRFSGEELTKIIDSINKKNN